MKWLRLARAPECGCSSELPADLANAAKASFASQAMRLFLQAPPQVLLFPALSSRMRHNPMHAWNCRTMQMRDLNLIWKDRLQPFMQQKKPSKLKSKDFNQFTSTNVHLSQSFFSSGLMLMLDSYEIRLQTFSCLHEISHMSFHINCTQRTNSSSLQLGTNDSNSQIKAPKQIDVLKDKQKLT